MSNHVVRPTSAGRILHSPAHTAPLPAHSIRRKSQHALPHHPPALLPLAHPLLPRPHTPRLGAAPVSIAALPARLAVRRQAPATVSRRPGQAPRRPGRRGAELRRRCLGRFPPAGAGDQAPQSQKRFGLERDGCGSAILDPEAARSLSDDRTPQVHPLCPCVCPGRILATPCHPLLRLRGSHAPPVSAGSLTSSSKVGNQETVRGKGGTHNKEYTLQSRQDQIKSVAQRLSKLCKCTICKAMLSEYMCIVVCTYNSLHHSRRDAACSPDIRAETPKK